MEICIFCDSETTLTDLPDTEMQMVLCGMCGEYKIANLLLAGLPDREDWATTAEILSRAARTASESGDLLQLGSEADVWKAIEKVG